MNRCVYTICTAYFSHVDGVKLRSNVLSLLCCNVNRRIFFPCLPCEAYLHRIFIPFPIQCILMSVSNDFSVFQSGCVRFRYYCLCVVPCGMCISFENSSHVNVRIIFNLKWLKVKVDMHTVRWILECTRSCLNVITIRKRLLYNVIEIEKIATKNCSFASFFFSYFPAIVSEVHACVL